MASLPYHSSKDDADEKKCIVSQAALYLSLSLLLVIHQWSMIKNDFQTQPKYYMENFDSFSKNHQTTVSKQALTILQWNLAGNKKWQSIAIVQYKYGLQGESMTEGLQVWNAIL